MIAYLDSSVVLRLLFGESKPLRQWRQITSRITSRLLLVEVGRVIDRCRLDRMLDDQQVADLHAEVARLLPSLSIVAITDEIIEYAQKPMPTTIGTLDALHVSTAYFLSRAIDEELIVATHDVQLARCAKAHGLTTIGADI